MVVNCHTEWDRLREVIVGRPEAQVGLVFPEGAPVSPELIEQAESLVRSVFPSSLIDEVAEDLDELCSVFESFDVKVHRPSPMEATLPFTTPHFTARGDHCYNVRDLHCVIGNTVVEGATQERHRYFEAMGLYDIWYEYMKEGFRWISAPKPRLRGQYMFGYSAGNKTEYDDGQKFVRLTEDEILFEPANTLRIGRDLLYLVSRSGNYLGAKWLQHTLGPEYRVHTTEGIYRSTHIDSTITCLRPQLVLLNSERVTPETCPQLFADWKKIYFSDFAPIPEKTMAFHQERLKIHSQLAAMNIQSTVDCLGSAALGMNMVSIDEDTILVDERQLALIKVLERNNMQCVPIRFRHCYPMGGGLHCSTLDTVRDGTLQSYV